jgi:hypothetical protein
MPRFALGLIMSADTRRELAAKKKGIRLARLIIAAVQRTPISAGEDEQTGLCVQREMAVFFRVAMQILVMGHQGDANTQQSVTSGLDEEMRRFDSNHGALLEAREEGYFRALPRGSNPAKSGVEQLAKVVCLDSARRQWAERRCLELCAVGLDIIARGN